MAILNRVWFFTPTINTERFLSQDEPTEQVMRNFLDSVAFKLEVSDTATETQQGLVETATQVEFDAGTDNNANGFALYVRPSMIKSSIDAFVAALQAQIDLIDAAILLIQSDIVNIQNDITNIQTNITNITNTVGESMPVGSMIQFAVAAAPNSKWLICEGQLISAATYPDLFALVGYNFGGAGANFNLPDLRSKFVAGYNASGAAEYTVIGQGAGSNDVTLTAAESGVPAHTHPVNINTSSDGAHVHQAGYTDDVGGTGSSPRVSESSESPAAAGGTVTTSNGDHTHNVSGNTIVNAAAPAASAHENRPDFVVFPWMIKALN